MKILNNALMVITLASATTFAVANAPINQTAVANAPINHAAVAPAPITTVKNALTLKDDTKVRLKGFIVKSIGDEKYEFRDQTGSITVDIDDELWKGKPISAKTPVVITGEVDIDYKPAKRIEIDVEQVQF